MSKFFPTLKVCILLVSVCTYAGSPALPLPPSGANHPWGPLQLIQPSPRPPPAEPQALSLSIQVGTQGRRFLSNTGQQIMIASAHVSDEDTVVIRRVIDPISEEIIVAFEQDWELYLSPQLYAAFDVIEIRYNERAQEGRKYAFTGSQIVGKGNGVLGYISLYYDAPPGSSHPVTVGIAVRSKDSAMPQPVSHYVLQRFETRLVPVPGPFVWVFVAGGVKIGEVVPVSALQPTRSVQSNFSDSPVVRMYADAPLFGDYLQVDLTASEQSVIHFDAAINAFQYGPAPRQ